MGILFTDMYLHKSMYAPTYIVHAFTVHTVLHFTSYMCKLYCCETSPAVGVGWGGSSNETCPTVGGSSNEVFGYSVKPHILIHAHMQVLVKVSRPL